MAVSIKDVDYVAELAKLSFDESEKEGLAEDLNQILAYVEKLGELDTENEDIIVNPYYIENKYREDVVVPSLKLEDVTKNAPDTLEEYLVVPAIIKA